MATKRDRGITEELRSLKRTEDLLTVLAKAQLSETLKTHLKDEKHRILYELTGQLSVRQLAQKTGFSIGKISSIWQKWEQAGLLVKDGSQYRRVL